jgi:tripartite-type tricarboxylate transporter receptor subunit TctC
MKTNAKIAARPRVFMLSPSAFVLCAACAPAGIATGAAYAQQYPSRPIRLVVPYPPGGPTDFVGRAVAAKLTEPLGQQMVVDNRPGAGTVIASEMIARSAPDGYNLLFGTGGGTFLAPLILPKVPYDPHKDYAPVAMLVISPQVLVVHPAVGANTVKELIAVAKAKAGQLNFASVGVGTSPHLGGELFKALAGVNIVHVPYKGTAPAMTDLIAGRMQMMFTSIPTVLAHVQAGRLKMLGTGGAKRSAALPDIAPVADSVPGFSLVTWYALFAPAGTPTAIVNRLNAETAKVLKDADIQKRFGEQGLEPTIMTPQELKQFTENDIARWSKLIKAAGIKATQ